MDLTIPSQTTYNLPYIKEIGGLSMKGRVRTREKCPQCGKAFKIIEEIDIYCPTCNTRPKTFFIFLYCNKEKYRISRDTDGHILDSYKRAHRLLESIRKDIDDGIFSITDYLPKEIEQFRGHRLFDKWLKAKHSQDLSPGHLKKVGEYIDKYYRPSFGNLDCRQLRTHHVEDFLTQLPEHLSTKTKKNIMTMLKNFFNWLFKQEILLRMPQFPTLSPPDPPITWITKEDQLRVLNFIHPHHRPIFEFMIYHPVRPGEAIALKVKDIDRVNRTVHIYRAFSLNELRPRKNKKPYYLPLSQHFDFGILKSKLPEAFVFTNKVGKPYRANDLRKIWHRARKKSEVPYIKLYNATRHSIASQALNEGVPLEVISKALGHSTLEVTKEKYAKMDIQRLRVVVDGAQMVQISNFRDHKSLKNKE